MENPDSGLAVEFFVDARKNPRLSKKEGRPIFEDKEFVKIMFPGDNKRLLIAPALEMHYNSNAKTQMTYAERFPEHYKVFKTEGAEMTHGTPVGSLDIVTAAKASELRALNITTVEQLASLPDASGRRLGMGWRELQDEAKAYLEQAEKLSDNAYLREQIESLQAQLAATSQPAESQVSEQFEGFSDDDLKNMIRDAGGEVPRGKASRETLEAKLREIAAEKEAA